MLQVNQSEFELHPRLNAQIGFRLGLIALSSVFIIALVIPARVSASHLKQVQPSPVGTPGAWENVPMPVTGQYDFVEFVGEQGWAFGYRHYARWDGKAWTIYPLADHTQGGVIGMKSLSADDIWLARVGAVFHWNGVEWQIADVPLEQWNNVGYGDELHGLDFVSPTLGWLVGANIKESGESYGVLFRWDGQNWTRHKVTDTLGLSAIDMVSETEGWMASVEGRIFRWNGNTWAHFEVPGIDKLTNDFLYSGSADLRISMTSATDGWMIGGSALWHWDGQQWQEFQHARLPLNDIAAVSPNFGWAVGGAWKTNAHLLLFWDGQQWIEQSIAANSPLILVRARTSTDGWLLAYNAQTGEGPEMLYRYGSAPALTATPLPTLTQPPLPTPTQIAPSSQKPTESLPATITPLLSPTAQTLNQEDFPTDITNWIVAVGIVIAIGCGIVVLLNQRRRS